MRDEYDFSKAIKNPYVTSKKTVISIRIDNTIIRYFKELSMELGIPYQTLINSFLADCASRKLKPKTSWKGIAVKRQQSGWAQLTIIPPLRNSMS